MLFCAVDDRTVQLTTACEKGDILTVIKLIEMGARLNACNRDGWTALHYASSFGHVDIVQVLLLNGASVDIVNAVSRTPLMVAVEKGYLSVVKTLLDYGAEDHINQLNDCDRCVLYDAADRGYLQIVEVLVAHGADVHMRNQFNRTALFIASKNGHFEIVSYLASCGAQVNCVTKDGETPILTGCHGNVSLFQLLLNRGASLTVTDSRKRSPLHVACRQGYGDIVKMLIDNGCDIHALTEEQHSCIFLAAYAGFELIVKLLLKYGAKINAKDSLGWTPLYIACRNGHQPVVQVLIEAGADKYITAADESIAIHTCGKGNIEILRLLVDTGSPVNPLDQTQRSPLHLACLRGYDRVVKFLLERGADYSLKTSSGDTCLHFAAEAGQSRVIDVLYVSVGNILVNSLNEYDNSPLHLACSKGHKDVVETLLQIGADKNIKNFYDKTPYDIAPLNIQSLECWNIHPENIRDDGGIHVATLEMNFNPHDLEAVEPMVPNRRNSNPNSKNLNSNKRGAVDRREIHMLERCSESQKDGISASSSSVHLAAVADQ